MKNLHFSIIVGLFLSISASAEQKSPRFVVNLLDYVGADYVGAVANGKVISAPEYQEQLEFMTAALEAAKSMPETKDAKSIHEKIERLQKIVQDKGAPEDVAKLAQETKREVIQVAQVEIAPTVWPSIERGRQRFAQNCTFCHGPTGHGDGPGGKGLDPAPANFHAEAMKDSSPFKSFNVIQVGVPGTGMAAYTMFSDRDVWDLAFFVNSLRFEKHRNEAASEAAVADAKLTEVAGKSDTEILAILTGTQPEKEAHLIALRLRTGKDGDLGALAVARTGLRNSGDQYRSGKPDEAKTSALTAYLEGIEPIEPKLRASDPEFIIELEEKMAAVRSGIEAKVTPADLDSTIQTALQAVDRAESLLTQKVASPAVTFVLASGIMLREGLEAILILIALLAVIRASGSRRAALWVHGGWVAAVVMGVLAWIFSGWVMVISGAQRELMEAVIALFAVAVLLYMGFWLHSRTEIHRWKHFIDTQMKTALVGKSLFGIGLISFMAVFREAFETVLFLRAVWIEAGEEARAAMASGVLGSFLLIFVAAWALLKFSARLPIRKIFGISSVLMIVLAFVLAGKGFHALQEMGAVGITRAPLNFRTELFGIYPTRETWLAQLAVLTLAIVLWRVGNRPGQAQAALLASAQPARET